jgi:hypothetical protein
MLCPSPCGVTRLFANDGHDLADKSHPPNRVAGLPTLRRYRQLRGALYGWRMIRPKRGPTLPRSVFARQSPISGSAVRYS